MEKQIIISISREFGSGGHEIAEQIAKNLGFQFYDRSMLDDLAREKNLQIEDLEKYDEKPRNPFMSRRVGKHTNSMEEIVAEMQFDYLREKADSGESFVIVGRCAETVLRDREGLISIFILGDAEQKIQRVEEKYHLNKQDAISKMKRHDKNRKWYHNHHSIGKWGDSRYYDICINESKLGVEKTTEVLMYFIEERMK